MKAKLLNVGLILSSLIGYLEWGSDQSMLLIEGEIDVISKLLTDPLSVIHPLTLLPMIGQFVLIITLFQKRVSSRLTYWGIAFIGVLIVLMFIIGWMGINYKILASTLPFILIALYTVKFHLRGNRSRGQHSS